MRRQSQSSQCDAAFWDLSTAKKSQVKMDQVSSQPLLCPAKENEAVW